MDARIGSSGFSYDFWKGSFYPDDIDSEPPLPATGGFGYLRLRGDDYDDAALQGWHDRLAAVWPSAYVFFKHEETAPASIERMMALGSVSG